jgi:hypothetical protein
MQIALPPAGLVYRSAIHQGEIGLGPNAAPVVCNVLVGVRRHAGSVARTLWQADL